MPVSIRVFALYTPKPASTLRVSNSSTKFKGWSVFARSSFGLGVKLYFSGGCYGFRSEEANKRAIKTVATTNLKLGGRTQFWLRRVWMRLGTLTKFLAGVASVGQGWLVGTGC